MTTPAPSADQLITNILPAIERLAAGTHTEADTIAINLVDIAITTRQDQK